jgi:hypothetical protein
MALMGGEKMSRNSGVAWMFPLPGWISSRLDLMVTVDPVWDASRQRLLVNGQLAGDADGWDRIVFAVMVCRRWLKWSLTRWARSGRAGRFLIRSVVCGIDSHVELVLSDAHVSNSYLSGWKKTTSDHLMLLGVAAIANKPFELFSIAMLTDDRLLLHLKSYQDIAEGRDERHCSPIRTYVAPRRCCCG